MISGVSSTATSQSYSTASSSGGTDLATLKLQLASKEDELERAETDQESATLQSEIDELEARIASAESSASQSGQATSSSAKSTEGKQLAASWAKPFETADKAAEGSKFSSAAMDVLLRMPKGGPDKAAEVYAKLDSNADNSLTKEEFVEGRDERMSEEQAAMRFTEMDTENKGSISKEQFTAGMALGRMAGGPPMGPPPGDFEMTAS